MTNQEWRVDQALRYYGSPNDESVAGVVKSGDQTVQLGADDVVTFGRGPGVAVQLGNRPIADMLVARHAGSIGTAFGRIAVFNAHDHLALDVCVPGRPPTPVPPGATYAPAETDFQIRVCGSLMYRIDVSAHGSAEPEPASPTPPASRPRVRLTKRQRAMLEAYIEPTVDGSDPATHQDVAERLGVSRSLVRLECNKILDSMLVAGLPLRNFSDTRDIILDAYLRHRV